MQDNIQISVKIDIRKLVEQYGSHFVTSYNDEIIQERIGEKDRLNHWEHQHETIEIARRKTLNKLEILKGKERESYLDVSSRSAWIIANALSFLHFPSKHLKANIQKQKDNILAVEKEIKDLQDGNYNLEVEMLHGEYSIPKHMPESGKTYFHLKMYRLDDIEIKEIILDHSDIYDYRGSRSNDAFADQFDFKFNFIFSCDNSELFLDSDRLIKFNGKYWKLSGQGEYIFLDKKEALIFAKNAIENQITGLEKSRKNLSSQISDLELNVAVRKIINVEPADDINEPPLTFQMLKDI